MIAADSDEMDGKGLESGDLKNVESALTCHRKNVQAYIHAGNGSCSTTEGKLRRVVFTAEMREKEMPCSSSCKPGDCLCAGIIG